MKKIVFFVFLSASLLILSAQDLPINKKYIEKFWDASWITHPTASPFDYGVYHFRKAIMSDLKPTEFIVHVSADNRYKLYVNGVEVGIGPARGDLEHWRFETLDIAQYLKAGENIIAAVVWNFGEHSPVAQITLRTAFILQGNGSLEAAVNTDNSWKVMQNLAYSPEIRSRSELRSYIVVGPGDIIEGNIYPWGWEKAGFDDSAWLTPRQLSSGQTYGKGTDGNWRLVPRQIPTMEKYALRLGAIRRAEGIEVPIEFLKGEQPVNIAANSKASILFDQSYLTTGYPEIKMSKGKGSKVTISYSEALFGEGSFNKGNRDDIDGKKMNGYADIFLTDGKENRSFIPLWNRTWRYMQLDIETGADPLIINDLKAQFTGYPFEEKANFSSDIPWIEDIWKVGWRTARLCAGETYFDCPYYEQMQYVGDTRIQALISLYVSGDDRLMRRAINDFDQSRLWNGLTESRYPSAKLQVIPPYSLFWIAMIHDHWMHIGDSVYVKSLLPGIQSVLGWYERQLNEKDLLGKMKWWHFTDWTNEWAWREEDRIGGEPEVDENGNSSVLALQYVYALKYAASIHRDMGDERQANEYDKFSQRVIDATRQYCWDKEKGIFSDLPGKEIYSQHANILAILTDAIPGEEQKVLMNKILSDESMIQATFYFKFYLFRALVKTGMADKYLSELLPWKDMLDLGLTTFAEKPDPVRSDCHAWSASPNYDLLATVAGIRPASPGFNTVKISPAMADLQSIEATMPHPKGMISVSYMKKGSKLLVKIELPEEVEGTFKWKNSERKLNSRINEFSF